MTSNSPHKYIGDFLGYLDFTISRADHYLWIIKSGGYEGCNYSETRVDYFIIAAKNPSKYMHEIEMQFKVRDITDSPNYYLVN